MEVCGSHVGLHNIWPIFHQGGLKLMFKKFNLHLILWNPILNITFEYDLKSYFVAFKQIYIALVHIANILSH